MYRYEAYLPGGAEEFGIALFSPDTYQFVQFLDWKRNVGRGLIQQEIVEDLPEDGIYVAKVFAEKQDKRTGLKPFFKFKLDIKIAINKGALRAEKL